MRPPRRRGRGRRGRGGHGLRGGPCGSEAARRNQRDLISRELHDERNFAPRRRSELRRGRLALSGLVRRRAYTTVRARVPDQRLAVAPPLGAARAPPLHPLPRARRRVRAGEPAPRARRARVRLGLLVERAPRDRGRPLPAVAAAAAAAARSFPSSTSCSASSPRCGASAAHRPRAAAAARRRLPPPPRRRGRPPPRRRSRRGAAGLRPPGSGGAPTAEVVQALELSRRLEQLAGRVYARTERSCPAWRRTCRAPSRSASTTRFSSTRGPSRVHLCGMAEAINGDDAELLQFKRQIPKVARMMLPRWRRKLYLPRTECLR